MKKDISLEEARILWDALIYITPARTSDIKVIMELREVLRKYLHDNTGKEVYREGP